MVSVALLPALLLAFLLVAAAGGASAETLGPFEPNESAPAAAGPLAPAQSYDAALESASDRDYFFFYATVPAPVQVWLTIANLGGGGPSADVDLTVLDAEATPVASISYLRAGETRALSLQLPPQKYFVLVASNEGFGDSYRISTGGDPGAFGAYSEISGRCAGATSALAEAEAALRRAAARLQRAVGRLRRSRYAGAEAGRTARAVYAKARARVRERRAALEAARAALSPWCGIGR